MITKVILGLVNIVDVDVYLFYFFKGLALQSVPFSYGYPASLFYLSLLSVQPAGGPLWGEQGSLNLYDETGVEHEKNVRRPRAEAVVPRKGLSEALVCIVYKFYWYEVLRLSCEANRFNCNQRFKLPLFTIGESHITI